MTETIRCEIDHDDHSFCKTHGCKVTDPAHPKDFEGYVRHTPEDTARLKAVLDAKLDQFLMSARLACKSSNKDPLQLLFGKIWQGSGRDPKTLTLIIAHLLLRLVKAENQEVPGWTGGPNGEGDGSV